MSSSTSLITACPVAGWELSFVEKWTGVELTPTINDHPPPGAENAISNDPPAMFGSVRLTWFQLL